jgi:hypothetical protein
MQDFSKEILKISANEGGTGVITVQEKDQGVR